MIEDTSSDIRPIGEIPKILSLSMSLGYSAVRSRFGFEPVPLCCSVLHFDGVNHIPDIHKLSFRKSKRIRVLFGSFRGPHIRIQTVSCLADIDVAVVV